MSSERAESPIQLRQIEARDDHRVAAIIRTVMPEFGASGPGFAINDPEVDFMSRAYSVTSCRYWVVELDGVVQGGGGIAPLKGGPPNTCELQKMYFLPPLRGLGVGSQLLEVCLAHARLVGFEQCYLETLTQMTSARRLYERHGFRQIPHSLGNTGHSGCDVFYVKNLRTP